ncbi:glycerophosphodiester phosphodiesterase GDPDL3-like isoform X2 [Diospyros lotus]|uniref:glycerophosphodiester phosphodiesterase GDPDL3-like isoform X2 n=1 Tax=Diospyros lotus TaxID=55363 RepID=UPI002251C06F|nr:glycerophosphodiester phosphodiesterase GDPDL3-like isoform X2 [Diospyros lotus]
MCKFRSLVFFLLLCSSAALAAAQGSSNGSRASSWNTLDGNEPLVIARGGFSGLFPDSSSLAYQFAGTVSLPNVIYWCDVQLTKDGAGICSPDLNLESWTNIALVFQDKSNTYPVNGVSMQGYFSVDFTLNDLASVYLIQGIFSRSPLFDNIPNQILIVEDMVTFKPPGLWLNIQHDAFFSQRNLSMRSYVLSVFRSTIVDYISSPEVNFLRSILSRKPPKTKLIFRFLGKDVFEPALNQTYGSLLSNLTFIKTFASGILVPKNYIWPVDASLYLQPYTSVVFDAHKEGLEVFASDFSNDIPFAYNYSFNPVAECLSFIDNGKFSVDGLISDFPITPSEAIGCFSHIGRNDTGQEKPLVISSQGSSGDFPGCTDLAYQKAISDGVDVLDCPVQMTSNGIPICLGSINLINSTTVIQSFSNLSTTIPELGIVNGIFTFNLTWSQIQSLKPVISNPFPNSNLPRDPKFRNAGKFMTLSEFLDLANNASSVTGVLISIEAVKKVMIQSSDSSVLTKFKKESSYELVYKVDENIRDADNESITTIKNFANSVVVSKASVFPQNQGFITGMTDVVNKLHAFKLPVYVELFRNEFLSQAWDFLSDANVEINTYVQSVNIDGIVTEFPGTAAKYKRNKCLGLGNNMPSYMLPVEPGLFHVIPPKFMPPAEAPNPILKESDVLEPPLPPVVAKTPTSDTGNGTTAPGPSARNGQHKLVAWTFLSYLTLVATLSLF